MASNDAFLRLLRTSQELIHRRMVTLAPTPRSSPILCTHANEVPKGGCPCPLCCPCKDSMCEPPKAARPAPQERDAYDVLLDDDR